MLQLQLQQRTILIIFIIILLKNCGCFINLRKTAQISDTYEMLENAIIKLIYIK